MGIRNCLILLYGLGGMTVKERKVERDDKREERKEGDRKRMEGKERKSRKRRLKDKKEEREVRGGRLRQRVLNLVAYNIIPGSGDKA